ncbi:MAG: 5'-methylthioadenosine/adenosylhomocysteine nucleosidase [Clostridia bacterium]|nr:5'-methylthioadenosine/adenosylhomocysteine nucleosidase [Clostridia bacterium]
MKSIGIVVAMKEEKEAIKKIMNNIIIEEKYNLKFEKGTIDNINCILVESGVGKVNAARTTQVLIDKYNVDELINVGAAGAISNALEIGDILIAKHVVQHDFDITAFGHKKGYISNVGDIIKCDNNILNRFKELFNKNNLKFNIKIGIVASGDIFCTDENMKGKINTKFDADVVDMECASIAQVAYLDDIPFISIRCISDIPNGDNASTFDDNLELASERCAEILKKYCEYFHI